MSVREHRLDIPSTRLDKYFSCFYSATGDGRKFLVARAPSWQFVSMSSIVYTYLHNRLVAHFKNADSPSRPRIFVVAHHAILISIPHKRHRNVEQDASVAQPTVPHSLSVSVFVSLVSSASPSVSLSSSSLSACTGFFFFLGAMASLRPPVLSAFIWPASDSTSENQ